MSGALVDLVALGIQDTYLTSNPDTSFFREKYNRHTNFAMEPVRQVIEGDIKSGEWSEIKISRNGDLLTDVYFLGTSNGCIQISTPFDEVQLFIGGQKIDTLTVGENTACAQMFRPTFSTNGLTPYLSSGVKGSISLQFFFGRGYASALPLVALQYHDVSIRIKWRTGVVASDFLVYADYVQLDTTERSLFAANPMLMLVEQHQRVPLSAVTTGAQSYTSLEFSHPVKAIYGETYNRDGDVVLPVDSMMKIVFNGKERVPLLPTFNYYQDHQMGKHTEHSSTMFGPMYAFGLYPNRLTPTGSCNFSRLDNARLVVKGDVLESTGTGNFYALNWNFLKLENGMGGLLFAN